MITESMRALLLDIFESTERLDKIEVAVDHTSRSVTIRYEDLDDEWFKEINAEPNEQYGYTSCGACNGQGCDRCMPQTSEET